MITIADWMMLVAAFLPYIAVGIAKQGAKGFDNTNPRNLEVYEKEPWRKRAYDAHVNSFEALPFFFAAVLLAELRLSSREWIDALAVLFILLRILYLYIYIKLGTNVRSLVFTLAFLCNIALFLTPLFAR